MDTAHPVRAQPLARRQAHAGRLRRRQHRRPGPHRRADGEPRPSSASGPTRWPRPATAATGPTRATARAPTVAPSTSRPDAVRRGAAVHLDRGHRHLGPPGPAPQRARHLDPRAWSSATASPTGAAAVGCRPSRSPSWPTASPPSWAGPCWWSASGAAPSPRATSRCGGWLDDLHAASDYLHQVDDVGGVWMAGFGTGGALTVCAAADDARVRGVAAMGAPADFDDWASHPRRLLLHAREVGIIRSGSFPPGVRRLVPRAARDPGGGRRAPAGPRPAADRCTAPTTSRCRCSTPGCWPTPTARPTCASSRGPATSCATTPGPWPCCWAGWTASATTPRRRG